MDRSRLNRFLSKPLREFSLTEPAFVSPADSVLSAVGAMRAGRRSCVIAMASGRIAGIFTERDVLTKCMEDGFDWGEALDTSVLTKEPKTISPERTVAEAIAVMQKHHYRTLPVEESGRIVGLIRIEDILMHLAEVFPEEVLNLPPRPHQVMDKQEGG